MIFDRVFNYIQLKRKHVHYGHKVVIMGRISVHGSGKIIIGNNVTVVSSSHYNPTAGGKETHLKAENNGILEIKNNVGISNSAVSAFNHITIEDNVMVGDNCMITDSDYHAISYIDRIENHDINVKTAPVYIEEGVFIGARSIILKGVHIGKHSVIGAGSVISRDIPAGEMWAGNPAKFIKKII